MTLRALLLVLSVVFATAPVAAAERAVSLPAPVYDPAPGKAGERRLVVAGGCFWGVQGVFQHVKGVNRVVAGYAGGEKKRRNTSASDAAKPATPSQSKSPTIRRWSVSESFCASIFPWSMIRPN